MRINGIGNPQTGVSSVQKPQETQGKNFGQAIKVTGIMLSKLDGSAKGGVVMSIKEQLNIPVKFVGLGETPQDIETFDPQRFVDALFGDTATAAAPV